MFANQGGDKAPRLYIIVGESPLKGFGLGTDQVARCATIVVGVLSLALAIELAANH
jgi:hypothetical protein